MSKEVITKIDDANKLIGDKFSVMKTTCKALLSFNKELSNIQANYAEQLLKLTKTNGRMVGQKKSLSECKEVENPTIRALIDSQVGFLLRLSEINSSVSQKITSELNPKINKIYLECKQMKSDIMKAVQNEIRKPLSTYLEKQRRMSSNQDSASKKGDNPERTVELAREKDAFSKEVATFGADAVKSKTII